MLRVVKEGGEIRINPFTPDRVFEKDGKIIYSDPKSGRGDNQFADFNFKKLLKECKIHYEINDHTDIKKWLIPNYTGDSDWEKHSLQFLLIRKTKETNIGPILEEIQKLIKEQKNKIQEK